MKTEKLKFSILGLNEGSNYEIEIYKRQLPNFSFTVFQFMVHCEALNALSNSVLFLCINNSLSANQHLKIMHPAPKTVRSTIHFLLQFNYSIAAADDMDPYFNL